jgi:hypothetical protein
MYVAQVPDPIESWCRLNLELDLEASFICTH